MNWIQIRFTADKASQPLLEEALWSAGAASLTYQDGADQPILEPGLHETPLWDSLVVTALFEAGIVVDDVLRQLSQVLDGPLPPHRVELLEDKDWLREWMKDYQPMQFGERIWVCPSWLEAPDPGAINLMLDPGLAFGTGTHPTTAMCLTQLDALPLAGKTVIDYGCGSGILAIAALLLGADKVIATDIDPQALAASRDNAERNGVAAQLQLYLPQDMPQQPVDVVLANILAGPLVALADQLSGLLKPGGTLLLSGLLAEQQPALVKAYDTIRFAPAMQQGDWVCLRGDKCQ